MSPPSGKIYKNHLKAVLFIIFSQTSDVDAKHRFCGHDDVFSSADVPNDAVADAGASLHLLPAVTPRDVIAEICLKKYCAINVWNHTHGDKGSRSSELARKALK